jgi:hypothetical protein
MVAMQGHPHPQAVDQAPAAADARDQAGQPTQIRLLPDASPADAA